MIKWILPDAIHLRELNFWLLRNKNLLRENTKIEAVYGVLHDSVWSGGRTTQYELGCTSVQRLEYVLQFYKSHNVQYRFTFSRKGIEEKDLNDFWGNKQLEIGQRYQCGVILASDLLKNYIKEKYPNIEIISSTTKMLNKEQFLNEIKNEDYSTVVLNTEFNKNYDFIPKEYRHKTEIEVNDCCPPFCVNRSFCYKLSEISNAGEVKNISTIIGCTNYKKQEIETKSIDGYTYSKNMETFLDHFSWEEIQKANKDGFIQFKFTGRETSSFKNIIEMQKYIIKPEKKEEFILRSIEDIGIIKFLNSSTYIKERFFDVCI